MARKSQDDIFTGTEKLADSSISAYKVGGMPLVFAIIGFIIFLFIILFRISMSNSTFFLIIVVDILLFVAAIYIYFHERNIQI